jgi:NAD(P)-dependent dehydrogenase (short-subunit alcohol dehydrogenase family)
MAILITGAGGGLGSAVVEAFLATGATVYGADLVWKHQPHTNARFHPIEANLLQASECERVAKAASPVDALLHLVGGFAGGQPVAETSDETWQRMLDMNLRSAYSMFRAVLPQMVKARRGRIVAIGSHVVLEPVANLAAYNASKAALVSLVETVALECKDSGITANVILPSVIDTAANRAAMPSADYSKWVTPESIAGMLVWLASDAARDVTGAVIKIR